MIGSPQYAISKWLCGMIQPVLEHYCKHNVKDTFEFVEILRDNPIPPTAHMCSFDVVSLFTNVPLDETIDICARRLYHNDDDIDLPWLPETAFRRLMLMVTSGVEFSFGDVMYKQTDGVAMGSPLGPVLANVFVGYCESRMDKIKWPQLYVRFVDDSFTYFETRRDSEAFLDELNDVHPALRFTCEHEDCNKLSFLDVLVEKTCEGVVTSVYRKPTFTGQYIMYDSYCSSQYKTNLVRNLADRARRICSESKLQAELDFLRSVFLKNGYPGSLLAKLLTNNGPRKELTIGPAPCRVFLCLPWKGAESTKVSRIVKSIVQKTYYAVNVVTVFTTIRSFTVLKDVLPTHHLSHLIYHFECRQCGSRYVGRTLQHLSERIKQHVPLSLLSKAARAGRPKRGRPRKHPLPTTTPVRITTQPETDTTPDSTVAQHTNLVSLLTTTTRHGRPPDDRSLTNLTAVTERSPGERNENGGKTNLRRSQRLAETRLRKMEKAEPVVADESTGAAVNTSRRKKRWHEEMEMEDDDGDEQDGQEESKGEREQEVEDESDTDEEEFDIDKSKSAIYRHLVSSPDCRKLFDDSWFSVICRARFFKQLQVLEAVYIRTRDPVLCKQKENVVALTLFK